MSQEIAAALVGIEHARHLDRPRQPCKQVPRLFQVDVSTLIHQRGNGLLPRELGRDKYHDDALDLFYKRARKHDTVLRIGVVQVVIQGLPTSSTVSLWSFMISTTRSCPSRNSVTPAIFLSTASNVVPVSFKCSPESAHTSRPDEVRSLFNVIVPKA